MSIAAYINHTSSYEHIISLDYLNIQLPFIKIDNCLSEARSNFLTNHILKMLTIKILKVKVMKEEPHIRQTIQASYKYKEGIKKASALFKYILQI